MILDWSLLSILISDWAVCCVQYNQKETQCLPQLLCNPLKVQLQKKLPIYLESEKTNLFSNLHYVLSEFSDIRKKERLLSKEISVNFNVLDFFSIGETLHSKLLGFFLLKSGTHGQGDLFLRVFLEKLGFDFEEGSKWNVSVESQRIDILIWRENPHSVVIIENKSNNAQDQENQIYRYWHKAIFYKNRDNPLKFSDAQNYKIIYLVSADGKLPSENSLTRPTGWSLTLPDRVPQELNPKVWFFNREISGIFRQCLEEIPNGNYRLKEYIKQYIEYWK